MTEAAAVMMNLDRYPAAVIVVGQDGTIVSWNDPATTLLGYAADEVLGRSFEDLLVPTDRKDERTEVLDQAASAGSACFTTERRHKNGDSVPVSVTIDSVAGDASERLAYVTMRPLGQLRCMCGATLADAPKRPLKELTMRQRQVLRLIAEGRSTREIAERLTLSVKTVETHRGHLMQRLRLKSVAGLVRYAVSIGLVPPSPWSVKSASVTDDREPGTSAL